MTSTEGPRASFTLKVIAAIGLVLLLKLANEVLLPIAIAIILTFLLAPLVRALRRRGLDDAVGAAVIVFGLLGVVGLLATRLAEPAAEWVARAPTTLQQAIDGFERVRQSVPLLSAPPAPVARTRGAQPPPPADPVKEKLATESVALTGTLLKRVGSIALATAATVILLYFFLASERWLITRTVEAIPRRRARVALIGGFRAAQRDIATFLGTQAMVNVGVGVATGIAVGLIGLPNPSLWGTLAGVLGFIPYLGPLVTIVLLVLAGSLTFATVPWMLAPAAAFGVINVIESNFVSPWIVGRRLEISPLVVFVSVMVCGWIWGIAGAFIAVPLLVAIRAAARRSRSLRLWCVYLDRGRDPPSLRFLLGLRRRRRPAPAAEPLGTPKVSENRPLVRDV
ncbi:MAG TPA: AI-2E family transporter [Burkholderiaceae bacterium]|nr:AI-2E family transporter [Burkholderiaceae bacterium]